MLGLLPYLYKCLNLFYYFISDIVIYFIYIDLMRKRCQLINVDVDVNIYVQNECLLSVHLIVLVPR